MSVRYRAVSWNPQKKAYDRALLLAVVSYLAVFVGVGFLVHPDATAETMLIRALGTAAFLLLHVILCIGPLARLDARFLPLLYNRRHMGVTMFALALAHGTFSIVQFHALGDRSPLVSVLTAEGRLDSLSRLPFQPLGLFALVILFLMASTSHDFWLTNLTAPVWKALHMLVYLAYALLVAHVALGSLQVETNPVGSVLVAAGVVLVLGLHVVAAIRERGGSPTPATHEDFVDVCAVEDVPEGRARIVTLSGDRVAVFRHEGRVAALSNACQHQNGPLGEGRIVDGCVTCPWHGYQYRLEDGASPPPFTERVPTFRTRIVRGRVLVHPAPCPAGTPVEPSRIEERTA